MLLSSIPKNERIGKRYRHSNWNSTPNTAYTYWEDGQWVYRSTKYGIINRGMTGITGREEVGWYEVDNQGNIIDPDYLEI